MPKYIVPVYRTVAVLDKGIVTVDADNAEQAMARGVELADLDMGDVEWNVLDLEQSNPVPNTAFSIIERVKEVKTTLEDI